MDNRHQFGTTARLPRVDPVEGEGSPMRGTDTWPLPKLNRGFDSAWGTRPRPWNESR